MKNETKALTPADAGLSLVVLSGPRGDVQNDWPSIAYTCQLVDARRVPIWTGEYRLGVGHVKVPAGHLGFRYNRLSLDETRLLETWQRKPHAQFTNKKLWADTAAQLAKVQKVTPKLDAVCHSLISDGSAFFDGQRFEEWAGDLGYDSDSIKAKETFEACDKIGRDLSRHLSRDQIESLREWASTY